MTRHTLTSKLGAAREVCTRTDDATKAELAAMAGSLACYQMFEALSRTHSHIAHNLPHARAQALEQTPRASY